MEKKETEKTNRPSYPFGTENISGYRIFEDLALILSFQRVKKD